MTLRSRVRAVRRRTGGVDREAVQWLFATCGVIASVLGVVQFLWPDAAAAIGPWWVVGMLAAGITVGVTYRVAKRSVRAVEAAGGWTIEIVPGDVLSYRPCVLTTDRRRTLSFETISPDSLVGQYLTCLDGDRRAELDRRVAAAGTSLSGPGEVLFIEPDGAPGPVLLLACGRPTRNGTVTSWSHLSRTYNGLWDALRSRHIDEISIPVIGAGYSRTNLSHDAVLLALLLSFHAASMERTVCRKLRIVIPPGEVNQDELVVVRRLLGALRYSVR